MADTGRGKVYENREDAEAAVAAGEDVDYQNVKGDDGLTDAERNLKKFGLGRYAKNVKDETGETSEKGGAWPSAGNSSEKSSDETQKTASESDVSHPASVPTTVSPSSPAPTVSSTAVSTGGPGTASTVASPPAAAATKSAEKK